VVEKDATATLSVAAPKTPSSLEERIIGEFTVALALPMNSQERSDALLKVFKGVNANGFTKNNVRRDYLKGILKECAEYGVHSPTATEA
jgi:hypothetical protein